MPRPSPAEPSTANRRCGHRAAQPVNVLYAAVLTVIRREPKGLPVSSRATAVREDLCGSIPIAWGCVAGEAVQGHAERVAADQRSPDALCWPR